MQEKHLIIIENDPILATFMSQALSIPGRLKLTPNERLSFGESDQELIEKLDVALIDYDLGGGNINGIQVGLILRKLNPRIAIVIYSHHDLSKKTKEIPNNQRIDWSHIIKKSTTSIEDLVNVIEMTAKGFSIGLGTNENSITEAEVLVVKKALTPRQDQIMELLSKGISSKGMAKKFDISEQSIRKDLSTIYSILVPIRDENVDLKAMAILSYQSQKNN